MIDDGPTLLPGEIMALAEAIAKRSAEVAMLVRALNKCRTLDEVTEVYSQLLLENGFVRNDAQQLITWCKAARVTGIIGDHALPVPAMPSSSVAAIAARPEPQQRLAEELVLTSEPLPIGAPVRRDWARLAAHDVDDEEDNS